MESLGTFFVIGGLILDPHQEMNLHLKIEEIRSRWKIVATQVIKFNAKKPPELTSSQFVLLKSEILDAVLDVGGVVIVYAVLHDIARRDGVNLRTRKGLEQVVDIFDKKFLRDRDAYGSLCIDRRDRQVAFDDIEYIFVKGRTIGEWPHRQFERIIHASVTSAKASHINSALDIVLGSIQYCINLNPSERTWKIAREMYPRLNQLLYRRDGGLGRKVILKNGFILSPSEVKVPSYKVRYEKVIENLNALLR